MSLADDNTERNMNNSCVHVSVDQIKKRCIIITKIDQMDENSCFHTLIIQVSDL